MQDDTFSPKKADLRDYRSLNFGPDRTPVQRPYQRCAFVTAIGMVVASTALPIIALYLQEVSRLHTAGTHNP